MTVQSRHGRALQPRWATISCKLAHTLVGRLWASSGVGGDLWVLPEGGSFYGYGTISTFIHTPAARMFVSASYAIPTT